MYNDIDYKVEDAIANLVESKAVTSSVLADMTVYRGFDALELTTPRIEVATAGANMEEIGELKTGNWIVSVSVAVIFNFDETNNQGERIWKRVERQVAVGDLFDMICNTNIISELNGIYRLDSNVFFYGGNENEGEGLSNLQIGRDVDGMEYIHRITFDVYCRGSR